MEKIRSAGVPLREHLGNRTCRGILTGLNQAFLINQETRNQLVQEDPDCAPIIKKFLRGESLRRWFSVWEGQWIVLLKSSQNHEWPWSGARASKKAEALFKATYPSLYDRMKSFEAPLRKRQDRGSFWWELRACDYYQEFDFPKIFYQEIQFHSRFAVDEGGFFSNNKAFFLPTESRYLVGLLNSALMWWYLVRHMGHQKDEALAMQAFRFEQVPIVQPSPLLEKEIAELSDQLIESTKLTGEARHAFFARACDLLGTDKYPASWDAYWMLDEERFLFSLNRNSFARSPLDRSTLIQEFEKSRQILRDLRRKICRAEIKLHHTVFDLYSLTPREIRLLRETAPPRDPLTLAEQELERLDRD